MSSSLFPSEKCLPLKKRRPSVKKGPGSYTVVKCGASGHNIRCAPSMYAAPIGMLSLGDPIIVTEVRNLGSGECWVRLEKEIAEKFAFSTVNGEVWSLAMGATGTHFIDSDLELQADQKLEAEPSPPCSNFMPQPFGNSDQRSVWAS